MFFELFQSGSLPGTPVVTHATSRLRVRYNDPLSRAKDLVSMYQSPASSRHSHLPQLTTPTRSRTEHRAQQQAPLSKLRTESTQNFY